MKRVRVAAGKHLMISPELATKVERVFATALTRQQALDLMVTEPRRTGLMAGSKKPLAIAGPRQRDRAKLPDPKQPSTPPMQQALSLASELKPRLANDFQRRLLDASMQSVQDSSNPLRLNNFSASFRELFRHVLVELAPDDEVKSCSWFELDERAGKVTRAQKVNFVVHAGLDPEYVEAELGIDVTKERQSLLKTIDRLNKFTHVNEDSFDSAPAAVEQHAVAVCGAMKSFLDCADEARKLLCSRVEEKVHEEVVSEAISETILSIDELATHHSIQEIDVHVVEVTSMTHSEISFTAYGSVGVELQWGSNSDVRNGDGAVAQDSYPLTCRFVSKVDSPEELEIVEGSLCVDTSSWWDGYQDEGDL